MSLKVLVVVDWQNDFLHENGALRCPVDESALIQPVETYYDNVVKLISEFHKRGYPIIFTRDWHPEKTLYFSETPDFKETWPVHCVQGTWGADFFKKERYLDALKSSNSFIINKGDQEFHEEYSPTYRLIPVLKYLIDVFGVLTPPNLYVCGVALEFCVKATYTTLSSLSYCDAHLIYDASMPAYDKTNVEWSQKIGITTQSVLESLHETA